MKKKLLSLILAVALIVTALSVPVLAAQKTYLPITIVDNYNDRTKISSFQVTKVEFFNRYEADFFSHHTFLLV